MACAAETAAAKTASPDRGRSAQTGAATTTGRPDDFRARGRSGRGRCSLWRSLFCPCGVSVSLCWSLHCLCWVSGFSATSALPCCPMSVCQRLRTGAERRETRSRSGSESDSGRPRRPCESRALCAAAADGATEASWQTGPGRAGGNGGRQTAERDTPRQTAGCGGRRRGGAAEPNGRRQRL